MARRNYKKLIGVLESRTRYALGAYATDSGLCPAWLQHVEEVGSEDPVRGLHLARIGVRLTLRHGNRCLRVRAVSALTNAYMATDRLDEALRPARFAFSLANDCPCCLPRLFRVSAYLRSQRGEHRLALCLADRAISSARQESETADALACRGFVLFHAENYPEAAECFRAALSDIPPRKKGPTLHGYAFSLAYSGQPRLVNEAAALIPDIETEFRDVRGQSIFRGKLDWLKGGVAARIAEAEKESLSPWQRYRHEREAAHHLRKAIRKLMKHRHKAGKLAGMPALPLEIAACTADLAALEARRDRYKVPEVFKMAVEAWPEELDRLRRAVCDWAEARKPGAAGQMWAALRKLRDMTVEAGCAPPLVPYLDPAEAL